jgi:hypothetical protein
VNGQRPYRCQNPKCSADPHGRSIYDFWAAEPVCPKCKCDARKPRMGGVVIPLVVLHFEPPVAGIDGMGTGFLACNERVKVGASSSVRVTGDPTVVTCPDCKLTEAYRAAAETWGWKVVEGADYMLLIDPAAGTITRRDNDPKEAARAAAEPGCCGSDPK